jgi:hypothetical protein
MPTWGLVAAALFCAVCDDPTPPTGPSAGHQARITASTSSTASTRNCSDNEGGGSMNIRAVVRSALLLLLAPLAAACYQSALPLGPAERGTIDAALVGSWSCVDPKDASNRAVITSVPIDRHRYDIEWREEPDHITRYRAYATRVGTQALLNVEEVGATRTATRFVFLRARPSPGGGLSIAVVREEALKGKTGATAIREITTRVADPTLYGPFATCTATVRRP